MPRLTRLAAPAALAAAALGLTACHHVPVSTPGCSGIDFDPPMAASGQFFGPPAYTPGEAVLKGNGLTMTLQRFTLPGGSASFGGTRVAPARLGLGAGQVLRVNSTALVFESASPVALAQFDYLDLGGVENFAVNGSPLVVDELRNLPAVVGGVQVSLSETPVVNAAGTVIGHHGRVVLRGAVRSFVVGGQELEIDSVCTNF